ncbi:MAG: 16S rRNA (cytosine(967)-C(5))-methyltransferase RsmB [Solirubrobacterales bacterium]|nr:16S rRNA (cytosine(967)-C(5))-methyltransferase RsmB [Solirubrobacterales bacterium]MBV9168020.1 16S rRNA (cytosine(967)-C(5))-methyltransferase RsmB [Solirubrobacterales bacterium]
MSAPTSRTGAAAASVTPARRCAFVVLRRVFEHGAYTDRAFAAEAANLNVRERALAMRLAYGAVQRRATLDGVAQRLTDRSPRKLHPAVRAALRLGLQQLLFEDGIADHAAVNETVELAKVAGGTPASKLVNAVLRRGAREGRAILAGFDDCTPAGAAVLHSAPGWLAEQLWAELGAEEARAFLAGANEPAEAALRVNTLVATPAEVRSVLPVPSHTAPAVPEGLVLSGPFAIEDSELWRAGAIMGQSRGSMAVARALDPQPGERMLDLCAAPGAKSTHVAALIEDRGEVVAVERHPGRARALERTTARMRAGCVRIEVADAAVARADRPFARVLLDPPCSGLGTLQSRPDIRWRTSPERIETLSRLQRRMLEAAATATAPGSVIVYSVCTVSRAETVQVVEPFLRDHAPFALERSFQLLPHRDHTDGFYVARLRRSGGRRL